MERYGVWPVACVDGQWSVPDHILCDIWLQMCAEGKEKTVFYTGGVKSMEQWLSWIKSPMNSPVLVVDTEKKRVVFVAWLNNMVDRMAFGHFCGIGKGAYRKEVGEAVVRYWSEFRDAEGGPLFRVILGVVPETNEKGRKAAEAAGFTFLGVIPGICELAYENRRVGGAVSYYCPKEA